KRFVGGGERSERTVVRADDGERGQNRLPSVGIARIFDLNIGGRLDPPCQEHVPEFLGGYESQASGPIRPGEAVGVVLHHCGKVPLVERLMTGAMCSDVHRSHWATPFS